MSVPQTSILVFPLAIEAQKALQSFRKAGLKPQRVARTRGEFVLITQTCRWRALICGPGIHFQAGLERGLARLDSPPSFAMLVGFCGGLSPAAQAGTLWAASQIKSPQNTFEIPWAPELARLAQARTGALWSAADPVCSVQEKQALASASKSDIVDMESSQFAQTINRLTIPFAVLRAVSDGPQEPLAKEVGAWCGPKGTIRIAPMLWDLCTKPQIWKILPRLARGSALAGNALGQGLQKIVQSQTSWRTTTISRP